MKVLFLIFTAIFLYSSFAFTQGDFGQNVVTPQKVEEPKVYRDQKIDLGFGIGLDYGGFIGAKVCYSPFRYIGLFANGGYYLIGFGWQTGINGYFIPRTTRHVFRPYGKFMFGTNRVIVVQGADQYNKIYTGFTAGIGLEFRFGRYRKHGLNIDLNYPINSAKFNEDFDRLKHTPGIKISAYSPVTISFGYHFVLL